MGEQTLVEVLQKLENTAAGLVLEVKGMRTHTDSSAYFLLIACEDLIKVVRELKAQLAK